MGNMLEFMFKLDVAMSNGFNQPMRSLQGQMDRLASAGQKLQSQVGQIDAFRKLSEQVRTSGSSLQYMQANLRSNAASLSASRTATQQLAVQYDQAQKRVKQWSSTMPKNSSLLQIARKRAEELGRQYRESVKHTAELERSQGKLYQSVGKAEAKLADETSRLDAMKRSLTEAGVNTDRLSEHQDKLVQSTRRAEEAQKRLASIRQNLSWGNIKETAMNLYPVVKSIQAPVKLSMDFEAAMAKVKAAGFTDGKNLEGWERMKQQALDLGAATKFTAVQAANAQENLIRANMQPEDVIKAMPAVLNMAAAEGMSIADASRIIAKGIGGMNLESQLASRYADVLAYTSSKSNTNIMNIGEAMTIAAPVAASQNIPLEKIAAYIGILANKGFESTVAGNALASSISRLTKMPQEGQDALKQLKVRTMTREGDMVELPEIMKQLSVAMKDMGNGTKLGYLSTIFGKNFGKEMIAFMDASAKGEVDQLVTGEFIESFGWSKKMADINLDTLAGQMDILQSSWDGLRTSIGDIFSPIVRSGVETLSSLLSKLNDFVKDFPTTAKVIAEGLALMAGAKGIAGLYNITKSLVLLPKAFIDMKLAEHAANMATIAGNASTLAGNIGDASKAAGIFGVSLSSILGTVGLIAIACYEIYQHWEQITAWATKAGEAISSIDTGKIEAAKAGTLRRSDPDYGMTVMFSTYAAANNALGCIYNRPILTWAAERGAEAIIPLTDKARGIPLLMQAAQMLGLTRNDTTITHPDSTITKNHTAMMQSNTLTANHAAMTNAQNLTQNHSAMTQAASSITDNTSLIQAANYIGGITHAGRFDDVHNIRGGNSDNSTHPTVNLTVNISGDTQDMSIAEKIKQAVIDALNELTSREERLAYA